MATCDRCESSIPISTADTSIGSELTKEQLDDIHGPSDEPFTIIEGRFAVWTPDLDVESRGRFPLLLCRECTEAFVEWVDNPDVRPTDDDGYDHSINWSHVDSR